MAKYKVGYFVGSLSSTSINRRLAKALVRLAPPELEMIEIPIKDLPLYSQDHDADYPPVARALKLSIANVDAVLFVTPEYNRSILGQPPVGQELVCAQAVRRDRRVPRPHRHSSGAAEPARGFVLLQFAADEHRRGVHPLHARPDFGERRSDQREDPRVPAELLE
jgi:NADPH-dependent FMN reductase